MKHAPPAAAPDARAGAAELERKEAALYHALSELPSIVIAYSGGVDSALLAYAATRVLGEQALCVTADSPSYPDRHRQMALALAKDFGFRHEIVRTAEMERPEYRANPANRCYFCKHELYTHLSALARERGIPVIADGSNADDRGDYRPGRQAAREFGVRSPLDEADLTKDEIRELSRRAGLPTWDEPASACLSSRIPYFTEVTDEKLRMIESAEAVLRDLGSASAASVTTTVSPGSSSVPMKWRARPIPKSPPRSTASCASWIRTRDGGSPGLPAREPERSVAVASSLTLRTRLAALAALFLAAHLAFLPPTLEDIDSFNFAMGVRDFDVAHHQPHPPG